MRRRRGRKANTNQTKHERRHGAGLGGRSPGPAAGTGRFVKLLKVPKRGRVWKPRSPRAVKTAHGAEQASFWDPLIALVGMLEKRAG